MRRNHHTKTVVVPLIVVAVGAARVDFIVVPRAAAQHVFGEAHYSPNLEGACALVWRDSYAK